ncbi:tetratricopeptide repeat protein [Dysgonomonas sp. Marseille-P4677]|uniref:tetratricopeptide repeat protein n=1 Tax=Dysgonomonas sp. Marseille-P4677 TaxID=2364790 RepID=UPI0019138692|nr:tetratricopeptide repeat protein [Dysgonomonas sp. Marseille-P4677]MBK5720607.1 tetratricopeptide repeat protein [Dysgonomonas sp. Marseille-P4677]
MYKKIRTVCIISLVLATTSSIFAQGSKSTSSQIDNTLFDNGRKFDYYFYEAMNAKAANKYDDVYDYLKHCIALDSTNANVLYELGNYFNSVDSKNKALDHYRKAANYDGDNYYYNMAYASMCLEFKQYSDAIEQFEKLVSKNPDNTELYVYLSESYRLDGNLKGAISALDKLEQIVGLNEKISLQKYQLYTLMNQEKKAFAEIQKYIDKYPTEIKYQILLGDLYLQTGKTNEAFMVYSKAKSIDPDDPYLISSMAEYYEQTKNKAAAEQELQIALLSPKMDIDTKLSILAQYVGTLQRTQKDTQTANVLFDTLMIQHPQEPKLNLMYGNLLSIQNKKDEARFQYQLFAEANPTNPIGWEQMLSTTFPDSLDLSIKVCNEAISYIPEQPQFYFYLGVSEYLKENYNDALDTLLKGVEYVDENNVGLLANFYGQIGDLYHQLQKSDSAFITYEKALSYDPNNLGILNNYSYYLSLARKNLDKAEKMSSITVKAEPSNPTYLDTYGWVLFEQGAYTISKIYIENAIKYSEEKKQDISAEVFEHYGDVLFKTGDAEKALEYWIKAKEKGDSKSKTLDKKIETKTYIAK